jgi:hypothetical protein
LLLLCGGVFPLSLLLLRRLEPLRISNILRISSNARRNVSSRSLHSLTTLILSTHNPHTNTVTIVTG